MHLATRSSTEVPDNPSEDFLSEKAKIVIGIAVPFVLIFGIVIIYVFWKKNQRNYSVVSENATNFENPVYTAEYPTDGTYYEPHFVSQTA